MNRCVFISGWGHGRHPVDILAKELDQNDSPIWTLADLHSPAAPFTGYVPALRDCLASLDGPVVAVGWSTGGILALESAISRPQKFAGLVLLAATPRFCAAPDFPWGVPAARLRTMKMGLRKAFDNTIADFCTQAAWPHSVSSEQIQNALRQAANQGKQVLMQGLDYLRNADCRAGLEKIQCPCLILHGEEDRIVSPEAADWMCAHIDNARCRTWPEEGHDFIGRRRAELAEVITPFLEECR